MSILPSGFQDQYFTLSKVFIDELGKPMVLHYAPLDLTPVVGAVAPYGLTNFNEMGEAVTLDSFSGRIDQGGANLKEVGPTETIKVRAYWERSVNVLASLGLSLNDKVVRVNCYLTDVPKLKQAQWAEINAPDNPLISLRVTLVRDFIPYGLGTYRYAISYWKAN